MKRPSLIAWLASLAAVCLIRAAAPVDPPSLRPWTDYRVIMWVADSARKQTDKFPLSNKTRGQRAQREPSAGAGTGIPTRSPTAREALVKLQAIGRSLQQPNITRHTSRLVPARACSLQPPACRGTADSGRSKRFAPRPRRLSRLRTEAEVERERGAVALRLRRGGRSAVNCTLDDQRDSRFQPQWPPDRPG